MSPIISEYSADQMLDQLFSESHAFITILSVPDFRYLKSNDQHQKLIRRTGIIGKTLLEVEPELKSQGVTEWLDSVVKSGKPYHGTEVEIRYAPIDGEPEKINYLNFTFQPLKKEDGTVYAIAVQGFDVTEIVISRKALEVAKREIENERENFRNLFRQTPEMVCILGGPEHRFEFVNKSHIAALGFDATGMTVREAQPESVEVHGILDDVFKLGKTAELREIPVTLGAELRYFNLTYAARRNETGVVNGVMILGAEITDVVKSRKLLLRETKLVNSMPQPFFAVDKNWKVIYWNPASVAVIGIQQKEIIGKLLWDVFPDLENSEFGLNYKQALTEKKEVQFESYYPSFNKWYRVSAFPFEEGVAVTFLDVTDRKEIESELKKSQERYQLLFDFSPLPKWIIDVETMKFVEVNYAAIKHYGYTKEEFLAMDATQIRPNEDVAHFLETMKMDLNDDSQNPLDRRRRHRKKDGTIIEIEMSALDIILDKKKYRISAVVDVTDRVRAEARQAELLVHLKAAKEEAEHANELKSAFLANMSHEIRTPLGAMLGFADLLKDPSLSSNERTSYVDILTRNGEQLSYIINDILDISKVEAGHLTLEYNDVDPKSICNEVVSLLSVKAKEKDLLLEIDIDPTTPKTLVTDQTRLRQILVNLVGNAIKFTQFGSIHLRSYGCHDDIGRSAACFDISDTGIGIPENKISSLFEMFVQADGSMTRRFGGTGLGLALSRRLARALGGDVTITNSIENKGTTFKVLVGDFPARKNVGSFVSQQKREHEFVLADNVLSGVHVLVVDDSPDNQNLFWQFLTKYGATVDVAENGYLGFRKAITGNHDVVLMDIQMPVMDGYSATQKLRNAGYRKPIIALTAHAMSEVRIKCLNVGCTDHLTKPVNIKELIQTVAVYSSSSKILSI